MYGRRYICDHPVYNSCTLFEIDNRGLAVIQQRYEEDSKSTWWSEIDPWLTDVLYLNPNFLEYFNKKADVCDENGFYPTVTIRQIMHSLKLKPLPKQLWETVFDRNKI